MNEEIKNIEPVQMKARSIRASEEVFNKFKEISEAFGSQGDCLEQLIAAYEINIAKHTLKGLETDISDYQSHIDSIQRAFIHVLELNSNAEDRIKADFRALIESKDKTIIELQNNADELRKNLEEAKITYTSKIETLTIENNSLTSENSDILKHLSIVEKSLFEKESIISDKQTIIDNLNAEMTEYKEFKEINSKLINNISDLEKELKINADVATQNAAKIETLEQKIKALEEEYQKELAITAKEYEADKKAAVLDVREQLQTKIEKQAERIAELMEQVNKINAANMELKHSNNITLPKQ